MVVLPGGVSALLRLLLVVGCVACRDDKPGRGLIPASGGPMAPPSATTRSSASVSSSPTEAAVPTDASPPATSRPSSAAAPAPAYDAGPNACRLAYGPVEQPLTGDVTLAPL